VGCLLIALGALNLTGHELPFLPTVPGAQSPGWTLVVFGVVFVVAATMLIAGVMLAHRDTKAPRHTVNRRSR
jgi:hypothetical protein